GAVAAWLVLNPPVTAITVESPTPITTAAASNRERFWTNDEGPGGSAKSSERRPESVLGAVPAGVSRDAGAAVLSICRAPSSQQPNSSGTTRCNEGSMERRGLTISGLKLKEASGCA